MIARMLLLTTWTVLFVGCRAERSWYEAKPAPTSKQDPFFDPIRNPVLGPLEPNKSQLNAKQVREIQIDAITKMLTDEEWVEIDEGIRKEAERGFTEYSWKPKQPTDQFFRISAVISKYKKLGFDAHCAFVNGYETVVISWSR